MVVDQVEATLAEAGDVVVPVSSGVLVPADLVELGEVVNGTAVGRTSPAEITVFKSVGNAAQDLAVARVALARALELGVGTVVGG